MNEEVISDLLDLEYQRGLVAGVCGGSYDEEEVKSVVSDWLDFLVEMSEKYKFEIDNVYADGEGVCFNRCVDIINEENIVLVEEMCFGICMDLREFLFTLNLE